MQDETKINEQFSRENTSHGCGKVACGCIILTLLILAAAITLLAYSIYKSGKNWMNFFKVNKTSILTSEFQEYTEKLTKVNKLILLEQKTQETITRKLYQTYELPITKQTLSSDAAVTISCPANFIYYVDLKGKWKITQTENTLLVEAPRIQVGRPAIEVGGIKRKIKSGWLVFGEKAALKQLEKELVVQLRARAMLPKNIEKIRPECREALREYIENWVAKTSHKPKTIIIIFPCDTDIPTTTEGFRR